MTDEHDTNGRPEEVQASRESITRRLVLGLLGAGGLGLLAGTATAQPPDGVPGRPGGPVYSWQRDVDANGHGLADLGSLAMRDTTGLIESSRLGTTADGDVDGPVTIQIDDVPALTIGPTEAGETTNLLGGHPDNEITEGVAGGVVVGGGGFDPDDDEPTVKSNTVSDHYGVVGGGRGNVAGGRTSTVGGGLDNTAGGRWSAVGGGLRNTADGSATTVGGGQDNTASDGLSTVAGGWGNAATGFVATVPGGQDNVADGDYSFAAGRGADTNGHSGAVVFGDGSPTGVQAENDDEFRSQMPVYAPSFNSTSARAAKTAIEPVDPEAVLEGVNSLEVSSWRFREGEDGRHMGPMAEAFSEAFGLGRDDETIATVDADGVAFAAIQGLTKRLASRDRRIATLEADNEALRDRLEDLEGQVRRGAV